MRQSAITHDIMRIEMDQIIHVTQETFTMRLGYNYFVVLTYNVFDSSGIYTFHLEHTSNAINKDDWKILDIVLT